MEVYTIHQLMHFRRSIARAKEIWSKSCAKVMAEKGDWGSCVIGERLYIMVKDGRKEVEFTILSSADVTNAQGSCVWETGVDEVIEFLKNQGIEAHFDYGHLD